MTNRVPDKINCIIVDDEPLAREMIRMHISRYPAWHVAGECINSMEAYAALQGGGIQVMFLDIRMPHIKGNDFLRSLRSPPLVVFTTAHAEYALEGFELNAVDYLLKPLSADRFMQAIAKVEQLLGPGRGLDQGGQASAPGQPSALQAPVLKEDYIFIKQGDRLVKVAFDEILFLEANKDLTKLYLKHKILIAGFHLKMLEDMLPASLFLRVHRSYMVSLSAITALSGNMIEIGGHQVPVSANFKEALNKALKLDKQ